MDKEKLLEYLNDYMQIAIDDSKNTKRVLEIKYRTGELTACENIIKAIQSGKFDKQPCETYSCAYCGETVNQQEDIDYHIRNCPKHPIAYYRHHIAELEQIQDKEPCDWCKENPTPIHEGYFYSIGLKLRAHIINDNLTITAIGNDCHGIEQTETEEIKIKHCLFCGKELSK